MQELLLRSGHAPAEVLAKGKSLLALWVQRQAAVGAFEDAFVFSALLITIGIVPALLIRKYSDLAVTSQADRRPGIEVHHCLTKEVDRWKQDEF